jgi:hypothetical protein
MLEDQSANPYKEPFPMAMFWNQLELEKRVLLPMAMFPFPELILNNAAVPMPIFSLASVNHLIRPLPLPIPVSMSLTT